MPPTHKKKRRVRSKSSSAILLTPDSEQQQQQQQSTKRNADDIVDDDVDDDDDTLNRTMLTGDENPEGNTSIFDHLSKLTGSESDDDDDDDEESSHVKIPKYMIVVDHAHKSIVMAIRGTMSIQDIITDLLCENVPLLGGWSHQGFIGFSLSRV